MSRRASATTYAVAARARPRGAAGPLAFVPWLPGRDSSSATAGSCSPSGSSSLLAGGFASTRLSALLSNTFAVPGTDSERVPHVLQQHFGDRSDGAFPVVFARRPRPGSRSRGSSGVVAGRAGGADRQADPLLRRPPRVLRRHRLDAERSPTPRATPTRSCAALGRPPGVSTPTSPGRRRSSTTSTRSSPRTCRRASRSRCRSRSLVLLAVFGLSLAVTIPFIFARCTIMGTLGIVYWRRAPRLDADVRDEPRAADRARDRGRLLAADRLPLPRGARRGPTTGRRGRADDADRRPRGDLLRRRSRSGSRCSSRCRCRSCA